MKKAMVENMLQMSMLLPYLVSADNKSDERISQTNFTKVYNVRSKNVTFKDFLEKFEPCHVWAKIEKKNKDRGINKTVGDELDSMLKGIDETDELLSLKVQNGQPKLIMQKDGRRRWSPPGRYSQNWYNRYHLKERIMELIKQAIYQARYKMVIMQTYREKYKRNSVYKMGFLMSKTDTACKKFFSFSMKANRDCSMSRQESFDTYILMDIAASIERMLTLWFEVDLLTDLLLKNDENCKRMLNEYITNRKNAWKFVD